MGFAPNDFLIFYGLIVILVVGSFLMLRRGPRAPTRLDNEARPESPLSVRETLQKTRDKHRATPQAAKNPVGWKGEYRPRPGVREIYQGHRNPDDNASEDSRASVRGASSANESLSAHEKSLNVLFNWNGHTWDAYEVLGVPAGSSLDSAEAAMKAACETADPETRPFIEAAFRAIQQS